MHGDRITASPRETQLLVRMRMPFNHTTYYWCAAKRLRLAVLFHCCLCIGWTNGCTQTITRLWAWRLCFGSPLKYTHTCTPLQTLGRIVSSKNPPHMHIRITTKIHGERRTHCVCDNNNFWLLFALADFFCAMCVRSTQTVAEIGDVCVMQTRHSLSHIIMYSMIKTKSKLSIFPSRNTSDAESGDDGWVRHCTSSPSGK